MSIKLCGHSHLAALRSGFRLIKNPVFNVDFVPLGFGEYTRQDFAKTEDGKVSFTSERIQQNFEKSSGETYFSPDHTWGLVFGGYPNRLLSGPRWRNIRTVEYGKEGARPISLAQLDVLSYIDRRPTQNLVLMLKQAGIDVFVVSLPLPTRDNDPDNTEEQLIFRSFMHNRARANFKDWLDVQSVDFIDVPPELILDDGFMDPEYMMKNKSTGAPDFHHGNSDYGKEMMKKIFDYLEHRGYVDA